MSEELSIIATGRLVGRVVRTGNRLTFRYAPSWAGADDAFPLSVSMPVVLEEHPHRVTDAWLRGLLPDNNMVLDQWGKRFHVSPRNPFKLLEHVGGDCAGAIQFVRPERQEALLGDPGPAQITWLTEDELAERIRLLLENQATTRISTDTGQFSLAGAQPKTALYRDPATNRWGVPEGHTPTTHILKPSEGHFDGYAENEHFCLRLAAKLGLRCASSSVIHPGGNPVIVVERYDRLLRGGRYLRVHQEDLCQALAVPPDRKYQNEGGPSVKDIADLLWDVSSNPTDDIRRLADALAFNWLTAGTDAHAKNYSLLIATGGQVRLAPLYDLASALAYPRQISPHKAKMAMRIGSKYRIRDIHHRHWKTCAHELRLPLADLLNRIDDMSERIPVATVEVAEHLREKGLRHTVLETLSATLESHAKTCRETLAEAE